jgi:hypothetical protein
MQALIDFDGWRKWKDFSQKIKKTHQRTRQKFRKVYGGGKREKRVSGSMLSGTGSEGLESGREAAKAIAAGA